MKTLRSIKRFHQDLRSNNYSDIKTEGSEFLDLAVEMDENGNVISESKFVSDGELEEKNSYSYGSHGKMTGHVLYYAVDDVTERRELIRNEKGFLLSETKFYGDDSGEKTEYIYNEKDNIIGISHYDEEGELSSVEEMKYDENGSLSERMVMDKDGKLISKTVFSPHANEQIEESEYDSTGQLVSKTVIKFDEKGKEISSVQTNPQGKLITAVQNVYDERGNVIEKIFKDFYSKKILFEYDERDRLIVQELYDGSGLLLRKNMYEYDDNGNVISEKTYEMDTTRGGRDKHYAMRYEYEYDE
jgi:hypothetical protein